MQATVSIWPGRQVVHAAQVAALPVVLYVDPAIQAVHPVLAVVVQVALRRVPAAQTVQVVQAAAFVVVLNVDPATQAVQAVLANAVQVALLRVPAAHDEHAEHTLFVVTVQAVD